MAKNTAKPLTKFLIGNYRQADRTVKTGTALKTKFTLNKANKMEAYGLLVGKGSLGRQDVDGWIILRRIFDRY
jgi:hypothetical protein